MGHYIFACDWYYVHYIAEFYMLENRVKFTYLQLNIYTQTSKKAQCSKPLNWIFPADWALPILIASHITDLLVISIVLGSTKTRLESVE